MSEKSIYAFFLRVIVSFLIVLCSCNIEHNKSIASTESDIPVNENFGKTDPSAYTPEIRENMKKLYENKFGMFVHWGPYAQLEGIWDGRKVAAEWIMRRAFIPVAEYEAAAAGKFLPYAFKAADWVDVAEKAGMKFMVVTSKHHDGFAIYKSAHPYNIVDFAGYGRDVLKELSEECKKRDMDLGFYYSQSQDWHEEGAVGNHWDFEGISKPQEKFDAYFRDKAIMQVEELTRNYGDIFMIWFDTPAQMDDEKCRQMMDLVRENQPGALVNSRLGEGYGHFDVSIDNGKTPSVSKATWLSDLKIPWQTHESVTENGWGYTSYGGETDRSDDYADFIYGLCRIVGNGGVYLLNVGPRPDGTIPESQVNTLTAIGDWLTINGEAIYGADPGPLKFPPYAITTKPGKIYLHLKELKEKEIELKGVLSKINKAWCLADKSGQSLNFTQKKEKIVVSVPGEFIQSLVTVIVLETNDKEIKVVDETIQQNKDGSFKLPVAKCEYATRRISYDYEEKTTRHWGGNTNQILFWTLNVKKPGEYRVITEDSGNDNLTFELETPTDTLEIHPTGSQGEISRKRHGIIKLSKPGIIRITVHPKNTIEWFNDFRLSGIELIPVE